MNEEEKLSDNSLAVALANAQKELKNPAKDKTNPYFDSRYATLDALQDASRSILAKYGLSITQTMHPTTTNPISFEKVTVKETDKEGKVTETEGFKLHPFLWELRTTLMHDSGVTITSSMPLVAVTRGAQQFGAEITYMRRYAYAAILNMTADEDDDGNLAQGNTPVVPESEMKKMTPKKKTKGDEIMEKDWKIRQPDPSIPPIQYKGPVDPEAGKPDHIPGLEPEPQPEIPPAWLQEPGVPLPPEEQTLLEQIRDHLHTDGFSEEEFMTLIRSFKLTRAVMLNNVEEKTLSTVLGKWETVQRRIREERAKQKEAQELKK